MHTRHLLQALCLFAVVAAPALGWAAKGELMHITTTMKMSGGPMTMPPRTITRQQCVGQADALADPKAWGNDSQCTVHDMQRTGNEVTAHLVCRHATSDVRIQMLPDGAHGTVHAISDVNGMHMTMDQTFDAKRVGECDLPTAPAAH